MLLALLVACGDGGVEVIHIAVRSPQTIDPAQVATVQVAAVREPVSICVAGVSSNTCVGMRTVAAAAQEPGFLQQTTLTPTGSSTASLEGLPRKRVCFVAEALSANGASLGAGCAEVALSLDHHLIEIELVSN